MSRPRYLADEDLRFEIVLAVRRMDPAIEFRTVFEANRAGSIDSAVLQFASDSGLIVVSHDVNPLKAEAERRILFSGGLPGVFLAPQRKPTRLIAESLVLIWAASEAEEWVDRVVFLPI
jgi:hypothetical protein